MAKSIGRKFIKKTYYRNVPLSPQKMGEPQPSLALSIPEDAEKILLPNPGDISVPSANVRDVLEQRRSLRRYSDESLTIEELSWLLWTTQGIRAITERPVSFRLVPSAGSRHAFETYLLINRVEGLEPGVYRYGAMDHCVVKHDLSEDINEKVTIACHNQQFISRSAVTFMWVAVVDRMTWRYPERGYRYLFLDAGHVCQNLYLASEVIDSGACAVAAYDDEEINSLLGLDGEEQFVIYIGAMGKK